MKHIIFDADGKKYKLEGGFIVPLLAGLAGLILPKLLGSGVRECGKGEDNIITDSIPKLTKLELAKIFEDHLVREMEDSSDSDSDSEEIGLGKKKKAKKGGAIGLGKKKGGAIGLGKKGGAIGMGLFDDEKKKNTSGVNLKTVSLPLRHLY